VADGGAKLKVAIDARHLGDRFTSNRTYWSELVTALIARQESGAGIPLELILVSDRPIADSRITGSACVRTVVVPAKSSRWWSLVTFPSVCHREGATVAHMQYTVSPLFRIPTLTTIHDISFLINPGWFSLKDRTLLRWSVPTSVRRAKRVITVSENSRKEILTYLSPRPEKVVATPLGLPSGIHPVDRDEARSWIHKEHGVSSPFALLVGGMSPRKNWGLAMRAVSEARAKSGQDIHLVITGPMRSDLAEVEALIAQLSGAEWIHLVGGVPDERLSTLYSAADVLVHPSLHEGFGLTPLEAFGCGTPVVASDRGAIPEVAANAARLLPPEDPTIWALAILEAMRSEVREKMIRDGFSRAKQFTWDSTAARTEQAYREAAT
jgi:glycosyltransferase involved in cell wall biosynthesis